MSTRIEDLDPVMQPIINQLVLNLRQRGRFYIAETRRSLRDQQDAFRRGASKRDGIQLISMHQAGLAVDIVPLDDSGKPTWDYVRYLDKFKMIAEEGRKLGLVSGQDWTPLDPVTRLGWDPPHLEYRG